MIRTLALTALSLASLWTAAEYRLATFKVDVTVPMGHALMGGGIAPSSEIIDPLFLKGVVVTGGEKPIVIAAIDWCEIRNDAYDAFRDAFAEAAATERERVFFTSIHQHDTPVADFRAQALLDDAGLEKSLCDVPFVQDCIARGAAAIREAMSELVVIDHYGIGEAEVHELTSNRRVLDADGVPNYNRTSATGDPDMRAQPAGLIDPMLKTLSFWNGDQPVAALHFYSVHPMSYYGKGGVTYDFPGMAREKREADDPAVFQIYISGASGDTIAGKWNDGDPANRPILADKLYAGMKEAWVDTARHPIEKLEFSNHPFTLYPRDDGDFDVEAMHRTLANEKQAIFQRNLAAMGISFHERYRAGQPIDMPVLDLGEAMLHVQPAEAFVAYQLYAQRVRPDVMVFTAGYGECAPGYIPSQQAIDEAFISHHSWCWVGPTAAEAMHTAIQDALRPDAPWAALPEANGQVDIPAQEWPQAPRPRTVTVYVTYPGGSRANVGRDTGLFLSPHNWGGTAASGSPDPKTVADAYDVVVINVDYLQSGKWDANGETSYDHGYLQALDALRALFLVYDGLIRAGIPFDGARMYAAGGSGGGNVSLMANKLAPRTFAVIGDHSGMAELSDDVAYGEEGGSTLHANWSRDIASPRYLSPDAQAIRYIGYPGHVAVMRALGNQAKVVIMHGVDDEACLVSQKQTMAEVMAAAGCDVEAHWFDAASVDGDLVKNSGHSVGDRTKLFQHFAGKYVDPASPDMRRRSGPSDFDLRDSAVAYETPNGRFVISYEAGYPVGRFEPEQ